MKKFYSYLTTTLFLFLGIISFGQEPTDSTSNDSTIVIKIPKHKIQVSTMVNYGSTNMNNEFLQKLLFGGRIENELKDNAIDKINKKGRFGVEVNYDIKYINLIDTLFKKLPNYQYYIGFGSYNNLSASYSKDLFSLIFYGNKQFENQTAVLGKSSFISTRFEKITIGLISKDQTTSYGVSLIIGDRINSYDFQKADMFTHTDGTNIEMDYEGRVKLSDGENPRNFMGFSGAGIGLDYTKILFKHRLSITNFGATIWSKKSRYSDQEKKYDFEGVEINNILKLTANELEFNAKAILPPLENKNFITLLPTIINFNNVLDENKKIQLTYTLRHKFLSNYIPSIYTGLFYKVNNHIGLKGTAAYGGYSGLRAEFAAYFNFKYLQAGIESQNVTGIFAKNGNGNGLRFYIHTTF